MNDDRWNELVEMAQKNFDHVELSTEALSVETSDGIYEQGSRDILQFQNQMGLFRLERENRPLILDKKQHYSHRPGDTARTEYVLSDTDFSHKLMVYKENDAGEWDEISADKLGL